MRSDYRHTSTWRPPFLGQRWWCSEFISTNISIIGAWPQINCPATDQQQSSRLNRCGQLAVDLTFYFCRNRGTTRRGIRPLCTDWLTDLSPTATVDKINTRGQLLLYWIYLELTNNSWRPTLLSCLGFWRFSCHTHPSPAAIGTRPLLSNGINNKTCSLRLWTIRSTAYLMKMHFNAHVPPTMTIIGRINDETWSYIYTETRFQFMVSSTISSLRICWLPKCNRATWKYSFVLSRVNSV